MARRAGPPPVGINPNIPLPIQRDLRKVADFAFDAQSRAEAAQATAATKFGKEDLLEIATAVRAEFQPGGEVPFSITGLLGQAAQPQIAGLPTLTALPIAGVYNQVNTAVVVNGVLYVYARPIGNPSAPPAWTPVSAVTVIEDTHANRVSLPQYAAANYPAGPHFGTTFFWETNSTLTDRQSLYVVQQISGVNKWVFVTGLYRDVIGNIPTDLGTLDTGFLFRITGQSLTLRWLGTVWSYDSGIYIGTFSAVVSFAAALSGVGAGPPAFDSTYEHNWIWNGSTFILNGESSQQRVMTGGSAPQGGVWYPCDGGTYTCVTSPIGTASIPTQNLNNPVGTPPEPALLMTGGTAALSPATAPKWDAAAVTDDESSHAHSVGDTTANITTVAGATTVVTSVNGTTGPGSAHHHALSNANAKINPPGVANGGLAQYYGTSWFMRA
jgi:hypothetical protein